MYYRVIVRHNVHVLHAVEPQSRGACNLSLQYLTRVNVFRAMRVTSTSVIYFSSLDTLYDVLVLRSHL